VVHVRYRSRIIRSLCVIRGTLDEPLMRGKRGANITVYLQPQESGVSAF